jgi:hypothetical protein
MKIKRKVTDFAIRRTIQLAGTLARVADDDPSGSRCGKTFMIM